MSLPLRMAPAAAAASLTMLCATAVARPAATPPTRDSIVAPIAAIVPAGQDAVSLAIDSDAGRLYVADLAGRTIRVLDAASGKTLKSIDDSGGPRALALDADADRLYVANADFTVSVIDTAHDAVVGAAIPVDLHAPPPTPGPLDIAVDAAHSAVYTANGDGTVSVIDTATGTLREDLDIGLSAAGAVVIDPATGDLAIVGDRSTSPYGAYVREVDQDTLTVSRSYLLGTVYVDPQGLDAAFDASGATLYVVEQPYSSLALDTASGDVRVLPVSSGDGVAVDPVTGQVYINDARGNLRIFRSGDDDSPVRLATGSSVFRNSLHHVPVTVDPASGTVYAAAPGVQSATAAIIRPTLLGVPPAATPGAGYDYTFANAGLGQAVVSVSSGSLPPGLTLSPAGHLTGTPTTAGLYRFTLSASGAGRAAYTAVGLAVDAPIALRPKGSLTAVADAYDAAHDYALVVEHRSNGKRDEVSVVAAATGRIVRRVPVGAGAYDITVAPDTGDAYVANLTDESVTVIDLATLKVVATVAVDTPAYAVTADPGTHSVYVAGSAARLAVIDTATRALAGTVNLPSQPHSLTVDPRRHRVYAIVDNDKLVVVDTTKRTVAGTVKLDDEPGRLIADPATGLLYITFASADAGDAIEILDESGAIGGKVVARSLVDRSIYGLALDPVTGLVDAAVIPYDPSEGSGIGFVAEIDSAGVVRNGFASHGQPSDIAVTSSGEFLLALYSGPLEAVSPAS